MHIRLVGPSYAGEETVAIVHVRALLLIALLTGCAAAVGSSHFQPSGVTEQQFRRDQNECVAQAIDGTGQDRGGVLRLNRDSYLRCMEKRGYLFG